MEYVRTEIVQPRRTSGNDPSHVGHITVRFSDEESERLLKGGGHAALQRRVPEVRSSLSASGSRDTDVPGFQDVAIEVSAPDGLDVDNEVAVNDWGKKTFQRIREVLEQQ